MRNRLETSSWLTTARAVSLVAGRLRLPAANQAEQGRQDTLGRVLPVGVGVGMTVGLLVGGGAAIGIGAGIGAGISIAIGYAWDARHKAG